MFDKVLNTPLNLIRVILVCTINDDAENLSSNVFSKSEFIMKLLNYHPTFSSFVWTSGNYFVTSHFSFETW